ncbi:MAG: periplasmic heavy metal sensor [Verrucomicrobiales bacterium]|jgi:hypothetical protein|nr:periplasmic heavy metal sensor [Verrucomicrobiales bacterium]
MKKSAIYGVAILMLALIIGAASFFVVKSHKAQAQHEVLIDNLPELEWVRDELNLSNEQFAKVSELHIDYRPICEKMCHRIRKAHERLENVSRDVDRLTPELKAAIEDHARIHAESQQAMIEHLYETAAVLDDAQAARYLKMMLPFALDFSHSEPEGVHGK